METRLSALAVAAIGCWACGDGVTEGPGADGIDANESAPDACAGTECLVSADYEDLGDVSSIATRVDPDSYLIWHANLSGECGAGNVLLWADLIAGKGALSEGIAPGTYDLLDADFDRETCGACIRMVGGDDPDARCYFASGGTLVLTEVDARLGGRLEDVSFHEIRCDDFTPRESDCSSRIGAVVFDAEYVPTD